MEGSVLIKALSVKSDELFSIQPQSLHVVRRRRGRTSEFHWSSAAMLIQARQLKGRLKTEGGRRP